MRPLRSERCPKLFAQDSFDTEPDRATEAGNDHRQHYLEGETLRLLDALAPFPQVREIRAQLLAVLLLHAERRQDCRQRPQSTGCWKGFRYG
jgi:hypothetical protein